MKYSIIIPAKNEENRIVSTLTDLCLYLHSKNLKDRFEIIVVVNNSTDGTLEITKDLSKDFSEINYVNAPFYTGKGGAVAIGFQVARAGIVGFVDADGSSSPAEVYNVFKALAEDKSVDGVIADRYMKGSIIDGSQSKLRVLFGTMYRSLAGLLFKVEYTDTQCGLKAFRKQAAKNFAENISTIGWTFDLNLLLLAKYFGYKVKSVPTVWNDVAGSQLRILPTIFSVSKEFILLKLVDSSVSLQQIFKVFLKR